MHPKFITKQKNHRNLYKVLTELREIIANDESLGTSKYLTEMPIDDMNWNHLFSVIAYLRLNKRSLSSGWYIYFQLYDDDQSNLEHFQTMYGVYPFCDCSYVSDPFDFFVIDSSQQKTFGNQWSILGTEDHIIFSKDLSWFLVTDCTIGKSTVYFKPTETDIIEIWKQEFLFEIQNLDV